MTRESRRKLNNSSSMLNNTDLISGLPDSILGFILSYLPTKNAVATSILSKRWKSVWIYVHNLDFCHNEGWRSEVADDRDKKFVRFVNRVLLLHGGLLNKFCLVWMPSFIPTQVISWINTAITRNLHHLSVSVQCFRRKFEGLEVPISLFRCDSLQSLELNGCIYVSKAIVIYLPRLETLKLDSLYFQSEDVFEKLVSRCPMLNYLQVDLDVNKMAYSKDFPKFKYIVSSTSLRHLQLCVKNSCRPPPSLELEASSLEYIKLDGPISPVFVQGTLSSLVEVDFSIRIHDNIFSPDKCNPVVETVRAFDQAKTLTLSVDAMTAISHAKICLSTKFWRLTKLEAKAIFGCYRALQDFIQSSDNLEVLRVEQHFGKLEKWHHRCSKLIVPVEIPICLSNNLKNVSFIGYAGFGREREMIGYMVKHGRSLEVMHVTCYSWYKREVYSNLVKDISSFPKKSQAISFNLVNVD